MGTTTTKTTTTATTGTTTTTSTTPYTIVVSSAITFPANSDNADSGITLADIPPDSPQRETFIENFATAVAARAGNNVEAEDVTNIVIGEDPENGDIIVSFDLVTDETDEQSAENELANVVDTPALVAVANPATGLAVAAASIAPLQLITTTTTTVSTTTATTVTATATVTVTATPTFTATTTTAVTTS